MRMGKKKQLQGSPFLKAAGYRFSALCVKGTLSIFGDTGYVISGVNDDLTNRLVTISGGGN